MKKTVKILTVIAMITILTCLFVGCNKVNSPVGYWHNYEKYTYDVENDVNGVIKTGKMVMEITRLTNQTITAGNYTVESFIGTEIKYNLEMDLGNNETDKIEIKAYFLSNSFQPVLSSKIYNTKDKKTSIFGKYENNKFIYTVDGAENSISTKKKSPLCDNEVLYIVLRAYDLETDTFSQNFYVPSPMQNLLQSVTAAVYNKSLKISDRVSNTDVECIGINIKLNSKLSGGQMLAVCYAKNDIEYKKPDTEEIIKLDKVPLLIKEGNVSYYLKSIDEVKNR